MKGSLRKYAWYIIVPIVLLLIATVILIFLSTGPQRGPFIYQIY